MVKAGETGGGRSPLPVPGAGGEADPDALIRAMAATLAGARNPVIRTAELLGARAEGLIRALPDGVRPHLAEVAEAALGQAYDAAQGTRPHRARRGRALVRLHGDRWHRWAGTLSGFFGGAAGLPGALIELPVTTTLILRSVQEIAEDYGEDPGTEPVRRECLAVFSLGGPLGEDDGIEAGFWTARTGLSGLAVPALVAKVAARFGIVVGEKLAAQLAPVIGAAGGAVLNHAFIGYYQKMAHVHFGLRQLERRHGPGPVMTAFAAELARLRPKRVAPA